MALIDKINDGFIAVTNLVKSNTLALANRLRIDIEQGLNATQQSQGRVNLGLGTLATQNTVSIEQGGTGVTTLTDAQNTLGITDNKVLNPIKIGEKWYQSGLKYSAEYPRAYNPSTMTAGNGYTIVTGKQIGRAHV